MKKIGVLLALAYALTTGMAAATVVAHMDQALTKDEARRIASNIANLPELLRKP